MKHPKKINIADVPEQLRRSPKGAYERHSRHVSQALGRDPDSTELFTRHPFDLEVLRVPPGKKPCPYHAHSAQWELFVVLSGTGLARSEEGTVAIAEGDVVLYPPGRPHQLINNGDVDLVLYVVADNPFGETVYYPDSDKHGVALPRRKFLRGDSLDYYDGEE